MTNPKISNTMKYPLGDITRSHHIAISVADIDACIEWYEKKLGCKLTKSRSFENISEISVGKTINEIIDVRIALLNVNGFNFELVERKGSSPSPYAGTDPAESSKMLGHNHMCFTVDNCDAATEELKRRGVKFLWEPRTDHIMGVRCSHFIDLEGNVLELIEELD